MGLPIVLPPLRDRGNDILILAKYFADEFCKQNKLPTIHFDKDAKDKLMKYHFPGNVRELKVMIDLAVVMCENSSITSNDITFTSLKKEDIFIGERKSLRKHTCDIIKYYLKQNNNDVLYTAKMLEIGKSTIYKMMLAGDLE